MAKKKTAKKPAGKKLLGGAKKQPPPAPTPPAPPARRRGASRMREFGYKQVICWFDATELALIEKAAKKADKRVATWVRERAYQSAMAELFPKASYDEPAPLEPGN